MSGQSNTLTGLFEQRMHLIGHLSQENAKHLQFLQRLSGHKVLLMKEPDTEETIIAQEDTQAQLAACQERIETLESEMNRVDKAIAEAAQKEK
ncbi:hypothetical protein [Sedimentitalea todarodis]|uniref:Uncharacterized protein n=1 Tax=Sedimentitalea todarodis TaxID=1631240 RepID=A0ABU3VE36_9RHOB|nr:hypothetical protein [Sedimentitalea todarodis]MDU9004448.1 hypothetical protein [Sedimentitalea todarodis]